MRGACLVATSTLMLQSSAGLLRTPHRAHSLPTPLAIPHPPRRRHHLIVEFSCIWRLLVLLQGWAFRCVSSVPWVQCVVLAVVIRWPHIFAAPSLAPLCSCSPLAPASLFLHRVAPYWRLLVLVAYFCQLPYSSYFSITCTFSSLSLCQRQRCSQFFVLGKLFPW